MDRKSFLGTTGAVISALAIPMKHVFAAGGDEEDIVYKKPAYLKPGDRIGITSPAGPVTVDDIRSSINIMESWGYRIHIGDTIGKKEFNRGGTDEERLADMQKMLDDGSIRAIMCARGGYGSLRIVDRLDWTRFKKNPKWVIGFSDITVLHCHIHRVCRIASIHSKMTNSFPDHMPSSDQLMMQTIDSIREALSGSRMQYDILPESQNRTGVAEGIVTGGNLKTIESLAGSASDITTDGKILFVEDTGEYLYSIDRMFWNLKRTGKLKKLKGLIIGGFRVKPDDPGEEFGKTLYEIILEKVKEYAYPVCFNFPVGHQKANFALKCGVKHRLTVHQNAVKLIELK